MRTIALLLFLCPLLTAQEKKIEEIFEADVVYGKGGDVDLRLNIGRPKESSGPLPCIVLIHGGGWAAGNKNGHNQQVHDFVQKGYVSATIHYRFAPKFVFPAQVEDVKCAIRFLRANAEKYGIDKARIGAVGFSAGAHLSMMLGAMDKADGFEGEGGNPDESSKVNAVVAFFGPTDFTTDDWPERTVPILNGFLGGTKAEKADAYKKASPITYVNAGDAPMLLLQGTKDILVPWQQATSMGDALTKADVYGRVELILGAGHGWGGAELQRTADETIAFFDQFLKAKKK
ncbi:MAG TPA: alpha/beta hydrolase [Planctomycetota bacterium]|nr:alpha/beta hydrolase [Planctomycetota bacterium]